MSLRRLLLLLSCLLAPAAAADAQKAPALNVGAFTVCDGTLGDGAALQFDDRACKRLDIDRIDPQHRILWLRAQVTLGDPRGFADTPIGVATGALASREIWWNGERIGSIGRPGASRNAETPSALDAVTYVPPRLLRAGPNVLALRVSSFHNPVNVQQPMHFIAVAPYFAPGAAILRAYAPALATTGALIAAALYFGIAFAADRRDTGSLLIALMALSAVGQLWAEALRGLVAYPYPLQVWRLTAIAVCALAFGTAMTAYVSRRFEPLRWRTNVAASLLMSLLIAPVAPGFDGKTLIFLLTPSLVSLVPALKGVRGGARGAHAAALGLAAFAGLILIGPSFFLDQTFYLAASGLILVLLIDQLLALRRARQAAAVADRRAAVLELELLRKSVAPHFLMNTLNALVEWVESDPKTGVRMIEAMAEEFQLLSQMSGRPLIPLSDEIGLCRRHLEVMSLRLDKGCALEVEGAYGTLMIPPGVLHTLIENAFTHTRLPQGAVFRLNLSEDRETVRLELTAPAGEPAAQRTAGVGHGLAYVRGRLAAAFGERARVESGPTDRGWTSVLTIPKPAPQQP
jgi:hypothetical protein